MPARGGGSELLKVVEIGELTARDVVFEEAVKVRRQLLGTEPNYWRLLRMDEENGTGVSGEH
jgi:hypothetical protein